MNKKEIDNKVAVSLTQTFLHMTHFNIISYRRKGKFVYFSFAAIKHHDPKGIYQQKGSV